MKIYDDIISYMNRYYPFMVTYVLLVGKPVETVETTLACVLFEPKTHKPQLMLNVDNLETLTIDEQVFVLLHETFHVMLNHGKLNLPDHNKANKAADIVINDYLVNAGLQKVDGLLYGVDCISHDSYGMTVKEVYDLLLDAMTIDLSGTALGDLLQDGQCDGHTTDGQEPIPTSGDVAKEISDAAPEDFKDTLKEHKKSSGKLAGTGSTDLEAWSIDNKVEFAWAEILAEIIPTHFKGEEMGMRRLTFNKLNRKVAWGAPKIILPVYRDADREGPDTGKKPTVVLAIDTSGSISDSTKKRFTRIARSIPEDKVELQTIGFTTTAYKIDIHKPKYHNGGTAFRPIENWILKNCDTYPDSVIVFTDGEAGFSSYYNYSYDDQGGIPKLIKRWRWFICDHGYMNFEGSAQSASVERIEKYVK